MVGLDDLLQTVDLLYAAALDRQLWPEALDRLATQTGGVGTAVLSVSQMDARTLASHSLHEAAADYMHNEWWRHDILREEGIRRGSPTGVVTDHDIVSRETRRRHPFFQDFWYRHGVQGMASYSSALSPGNVTVFSIQRSIKAGDFEPAELRVLETLGPHAARALRIANRLADAEARATSLEHMIERFAVAAVLVDRRGRVEVVNARAHEAMGRGYTIARGTIRATTGSGQKALDGLMRSVFETREAAPRHALLPLPDGSPGVVAQAFLLPRLVDLPFDMAYPDHAVVVLTEQAPPVTEGPIAALRAIGLTPAEARVASIVGAGLSPSDAAATLNIKVSTVRVVLKSVFAKLGIRRQSELASLVARLTMVR